MHADQSYFQMVVLRFAVFIARRTSVQFLMLTVTWTFTKIFVHINADFATTMHGPTVSWRCIWCDIKEFASICVGFATTRAWPSRTLIATQSHRSTWWKHATNACNVPRALFRQSTWNSTVRTSTAWRVMHWLRWVMGLVVDLLSPELCLVINPTVTSAIRFCVSFKQFFQAAFVAKHAHNSWARSSLDNYITVETPKILLKTSIWAHLTENERIWHKIHTIRFNYDKWLFSWCR